MLLATYGWLYSSVKVYSGVCRLRWSVELLMKDSGSPTRTFSPSVCSRAVCHWVTCSCCSRHRSVDHQIISAAAGERSFNSSVCFALAVNQARNLLATRASFRRISRGSCLFLNPCSASSHQSQSKSRTAGDSGERTGTQRRPTVAGAYVVHFRLS